MADEFKTLREVAIALDGVRRQFSWHTGVFGVAVTIAVAGYWFMFSKTDRVEDAVARIETKLEAIDDKLTKIATDSSASRTDVGELKTMLSSAQPIKPYFPSPEEEALVSKLGGVLEPNKFMALESGWRTYGDLKSLAAELTDEQREQIRDACLDALKSPEPFHLYLLGICAAVTNQ